MSKQREEAYKRMKMKARQQKIRRTDLVALSSACAASCGYANQRSASPLSPSTEARALRSAFASGALAAAANSASAAASCDASAGAGAGAGAAAAAAAPPSAGARMCESQRRDGNLLRRERCCHCPLLWSYR